jgi:hypothetical protein
MAQHRANFGVQPDIAAEVARRFGAKVMGKLGEHGDIPQAVMESASGWQYKRTALAAGERETAALAHVCAVEGDISTAGKGATFPSCGRSGTVYSSTFPR